MTILKWIATAILLLVLGIVFIWGMAALADDDSYRHAQGHDSYKGWSSRKAENCCDNQDCKFLEENEWRESERGTEILIEGQWCPVNFEHFLTRGRSPDWTKAHACINRRAFNMPACSRLLCFVGIPRG